MKQVSQQAGHTQAPELLAPAGNMECLHAAVRAGADAVYLGAGDFNARRGAENFTIETLTEACAWAHLREVRIYLTVNTVVLPGELAAAHSLVGQAWEAGVDAFIVQDIGLAADIVRGYPQAEVHISTQMNTHNAAGVQAAAALGATRVTLARELELSEIANLSEVAHSSGMQVEVFAHGALCTCYSGQCFMSSLVGGRSANRGMCAQACRLPYELHNATANKALVSPGEYLLSPKDLCTIDLLSQLAGAGVDSVKIEGRMKSPDYVYNVVSVYRSVLDRVAGTQSYEPLATPEERQQLEEAFSRGFTSAYLTGKTGNEMMSYTRPNNRGILVGRVANVRDGLVEISCDVPLEVGDVIEFWTNKGRFAHTVGLFEQKGSGALALEVSKPVGKGDRVFRVRSVTAAFIDDPQEPRVPVNGNIELRRGYPVCLTLKTSGGGSTVTIEGPLVEPARTKAISVDDVHDHVDRFGTTPFALRSLEVQLDSNVGLGFSTLHHVRAEAAQALQEQLLQPWKARRQGPSAQEKTFTNDVGMHYKEAPVKQELQVCAWATNAACARAAKKAGANKLYVPALYYGRGEAIVAGQRIAEPEQAGYPKQITIALPVIEHDALPTSREGIHSFDAWHYAKEGKPVFADSFAAVSRALAAGRQVEVGPHVPVANASTVQLFEDMGVSRIWLSPELTLGQIQRIAENSQVPLGLFVSGAAELMITEHCLLMSQGPCNQDCSACSRRKAFHYLKDRKGFEMPVVTDCCGRSHLYNAVSLDLCHLLPDLVSAGISAFMVDTTLLNVKEAAEATARAVHACDLYTRTGEAIGKREGTTTGHIFRGVS